MNKVKVIGAGLAGSEAAIYLANNGFKVELFEMRPKYQTGAHKTDCPAEFVCSNSLGSLDVTSASGLLKKEALILGSTLFKEALNHCVPSGNSLSIDRFGFCNRIKEIIFNHPNINYKNELYDAIDPSAPTIIATGPLTNDKLAQNIKYEFGHDGFHFFDAIAPIVEKNQSILTRLSMLQDGIKGNADFINCPMNKEEYENFYNILTTAQRIELHDFEASYFEGCMPVEVMASRGIDTLRFGPLKPVGLFDKRIPTEFKKNQFWAVVQLRQDDKMAELYNLVGFQTNLKYPEQKRLIHAIPGLENANIIRYGQMHANIFINSPMILNKYLQTNKYKNIFFAGQITGVEGYCESISTGLLAGININRMLNNKPMIELPSTTMLGSLVSYITYNKHKKFQPINSNWGIVEDIQVDKKYRKDKKYKNELRSNRSQDAIERVKHELYS